MKFVLTGTVVVGASFYNLSNGQFEPIVERSTFNVALLRNHDSYPSTSFQWEGGPLNINVHYQFIRIVR